MISAELVLRRSVLIGVSDRTGRKSINIAAWPQTDQAVHADEGSDACYELHLSHSAVRSVSSPHGCLYLYRHWLENHGDHYIHLHNDQHDSAIINAQRAICKRCEMVDKLKYGTLIATILYAVAISGGAIIEAWNRPILVNSSDNSTDNRDWILGLVEGR